MNNENYAGEEFPEFKNIEQELKSMVEKIQDNFLTEKILQVENFRKKNNHKDVIRNFFESVLKIQPNSSKTEKDEENEILNEYRGIYVFAEKDNDQKWKYMYTGISRKGIQRLNDHVNPTNKGTASWAYLMVKEEDYKKEIKKFFNRKDSDLSKTESEEKKDLEEKITKKIKEKQSKVISEYYITFVPVNDNYFLHMVEPYVAANLKCKWNSFKTH